MDNQLAEIKQQELVTLIEQNSIGDIIKPLIREIYLFDSYIAGTTYLNDKAVLDEIAVGDKLSLQRENNKFDDNAITLYTDTQKKLGYVPEKDNVVFARLLDAGKILSAKIKSIEKKGTFHKISIEIYLVDI